eukprot:TRINITY_DN5223_c0_g1_i2.p1 TRINITY_DN5223_c0_g1~~TRINITY_DN5223_c0_g1_i2.p1  ORF type:complete len:178 (+),score=33.61 TRINITY_DN5223_c0_g1_i2:99-632(+)
MRGRGTGNFSKKSIVILCVCCFLTGSLFTNRMWSPLDATDDDVMEPKRRKDQEVKNAKDGCDHNRKLAKERDIMGEVFKTQETIQMLDKTISSLESELAASRSSQGVNHDGSPLLGKPPGDTSHKLPKVFVVIGINTAFSSRKRRDSQRETWIPQGTNLKKLEQEKGIVIRFVIGHR